MSAYRIKNNLTVTNTVENKRNISTVANHIPNWVTAIGYELGDYIVESDKIYRCILNHTSSTFTTDLALNWVEVSKVAKLPERINTTATLSPGIYDIDSSTASFNITLTNEIGEWFFTNTNFSLDTNAVTLLSGGSKTFTNSLGVQTLGDFIANKGGKDFNVLHTELGNDYRVNTDTEKQLSPVFRPNGGWDASTNTPDLTVNTNKVNGNDYYVYYVTTTGSQNLGNGATVFEAGGRIEWYSNTVYNYVAPQSSTAYLQQTLIANGTVTDWGYTTIVNSATPVTITLPLVGISSVGETVVIKNIGAGLVTVVGNGTDVLSGSTTLNQDDSAIYEATALGVVHSISDKVASASITTTPLTYGRVIALLDLPSTTHINTDPGTKIPFTGSPYTSGMTVNAGSITPSVSGRYRADWLCMAASTDFLADGIFHIVQNGVSVGQVSYNMNEASAVNQSAGFIDVNLVAGQEVSLNYRTRHTASDGIAWDRGSYFQLTQLPTAVAPVIDAVAEYGENNGIVNNQSTASTAFVDVTGGSFTLPSAGVWEVQYNLTSSGNSVGNRCRYQLVRASDGAVVANSSAGFVYPVANHIEHVSQKSFITTTGADVYKLQFRTDGGTLTLVNANDNSGGNSKITWSKIAGQLPSTGQTVDVGYYTKPLANAVLGDITGFVAQSGNIPSNGTTFNLTAGKTYELTANIEARDLDASNVVEINWVNASNVALSGSISARVEDHGTVSTDLGRSLNITLIYTPTVNESVKLSVINLTGALNIGGNVIIKQLGSSNLLTTNSQINATDGYTDIPGTNVRMQWGTLLFGTSGTPITLPAAFANTNYTVVVSSAAGVNIFVTTGTKTTSNFICITLTNVGSPSNNNPISYYAIGQKP